MVGKGFGNGDSYVAKGYAIAFLTSLALSIAGAVMFFTGFSFFPLYWVYAACLVVFLVAVSIDVTYTLHKKKVTMAEVEVEVPRVVPGEVVEAKAPRKKAGE